MNPGGAYGGGKAGASFDIITFVQRPQVILRALCWVRIAFLLFLLNLRETKVRTLQSKFMADAPWHEAKLREEDDLY